MTVDEAYIEDTAYDDRVDEAYITACDERSEAYIEDTA